MQGSDADDFNIDYNPAPSSGHWQQFIVSIGGTHECMLVSDAIVKMVRVMSGAFIVKVGKPSEKVRAMPVVIESEEKPIPIVQWDEKDKEWVVAGEPLECNTFCMHGDEPAIHVRLEAGATVHVLSALDCFFCNIGEHSHGELVVVAEIQEGEEPLGRERLFDVVLADDQQEVVGCR